MIVKRLILLAILGTLAIQIAAVSFPTERSESEDLEEIKKDEGEARFNHALHREKKKRKRQRLACLLALQQVNNRYKRAAPAIGDERTLLWGGFNYYNTDVHVYNGGYGGQRPSLAPGDTSNPCQGLPGLSGFPGLPSLPSFPTFPNFPSIGNEIIHIVNPGSGSSSSSSSSSSGNRPGNRPGNGGGLGSFGNGGTPAPVTTTSAPDGGDSDGDNEDYDYSDGDSDGDSNRIKRRRRPSQNSPFVNAIRPASNYIDYFVLRPIDRTFRQIVRWF